MMRRAALVLLVLCLSGAPSAAPAAPAFDAAARSSDLNWLIDQIAAHYAYLPQRHLDLAKLRRIYLPQAKAADTDSAWLHVLERVIGELHDHHATLGANSPSSPQLIPTGIDIWAGIQNGQAIIEEVRAGSPAEAAALRAGDTILSIDGAPIASSIAQHQPEALFAPDPEAADFTLRTLLAGTHDRVRRISVRAGNGAERDIVLPPYRAPQSDTPLTWRMLDHGIGYIRIANSLGDSATVAAMDAALDRLKNAKGLILDLRDTPSGGNTDVAEPIMGRFIAKAAPYQRVFNPAPGKTYPENSWLKPVSPRGTTVRVPLVVLVDHWTGSMGEGMTIGFVALHRATIVGTPMARLKGGTGDFVLPNTGIWIHFPVEMLFQVNGAPRENFVPPVAVDLRKARGDVILTRGQQIMARLITH